MFDMEPDESQPPGKWWELLDDTAAFLNFHYDEIMATGSDELKRAAAIILNGHKPGGAKIKGESA